MESKSKNGGTFDPSATPSMNFGVSTSPVVHRFFTLGSFPLSYYLTPCFQAFIRSLPRFFARVFLQLPVARRLRFGLLCGFPAPPV